MSMLVMLGMSAMAEDIIWQEDWTGCAANALPSEINPTYASEGTGTKIYDANLAGGTAPELLIAKNNGSFIVRIEFNGKHGDMVLSYMANYDRITVNVLQGAGVTLGEKTAVGNSYSIPMTVAEGSFDVTLQFQNTTSSNVRFDNAKLYQGTAKKPAGLSWGKASTTLTIGEEITLTLSNENQLPVTYSSSEESVATINAEGVITLVAAGKTVLTAAFAGNDEYEAQSVSIEVTVKEGGDNPDPDPEIAKITVNTALQLIAELEDGKTTDQEYQVEGYVIEVSDISTQYGNATFTIADAANGTDVLTVFRVKGFNGENITNANLLKAGDLVVVQGKLQKYVKNEVITPELAQGGKIVSINGKTSDDTPEVDPNTKGQVNNPYTVEEAAEALKAGPVTGNVYVKGFITNIDELSTQYGNATFRIATNNDKDAELKLKAYRAKYLENNAFTAEDQIKVGDEVVLCGKLAVYGEGDKAEGQLTNGYIYSLNGKTKPEEKPVELVGDGSLNNPYTVADALKVVGAMEAGVTSTDDYYIKGKISSIKYMFSAQYGTATFNISDNGEAENEFTCYSIYYLENTSWVEGCSQVAVGDDVIVYGKVVNYNGNTPETASKKAYIYSLNGITSGITEVGTSRLQKDVIYNLRGQRVSVAKNGLYIINGKKVFVK